MSKETDLLRRAAQLIQDNAPGYCMGTGGTPETDDETDDQLSVAHSLLAMADEWERAEPVGCLYQHEETGRTTFVELDRADVFDHENLRWNYVGRLYLHPAPDVRELTELQDLSKDPPVPF